MDTDFLKNSLQKTVAQRNLFLVLTVAQLAITFVLVLFLFSKKERVVVIPTQGASYWIEENKVSDIYIEKMGIYLSDLLLNRSPVDVEKKNRSILEHVQSSCFQEFKKQLQLEKEGMLKGNQSYFFKTERGYVDSARLSYIIEGDFLVLVGRTGETPVCAQRERKKFILQFQCHNGKLLLTSLKKESLK